MENIGQFTPLVLMLLVVYFFMIAPQMKRAKKEKKFAAELKKGNKVITKSGMHGKIAELNDKDPSCDRATQAGNINFDRSASSLGMSQKLTPTSSVEILSQSGEPNQAVLISDSGVASQPISGGLGYIYNQGELELAWGASRPI